MGWHVIATTDLMANDQAPNAAAVTLRVGARAGDRLAALEATPHPAQRLHERLVPLLDRTPRSEESGGLPVSPAVLPVHEAPAERIRCRFSGLKKLSYGIMPCRAR